jgi:hypothetical protein
MDERRFHSRPDVTMPSEPIRTPMNPCRGQRVLEYDGHQWRPSIPIPLELTFRKQCFCRRKFWTMEGYKGHYALQHIIRGR